MNFLKRQINSAIREFRQQNWDKLFQKTASNNDELWKLTRKFTRKSQVIPTLTDEMGNVYETDAEKTTVLAYSLYKQFDKKEPRNRGELMFYNELERRLPKCLENPDNNLLEEITVAEISAIIKNLKKGKAPGNDKVNNNMLKNLPGNTVECLKDILNSCLRLMYFPKKWKEALVTMLHKKGKNAKNPSSYRPISLLPTMGKILERCILNRLSKIVEEKNLIPNSQCGFRAQHSCVLQAWRLTEQVKEVWQKKKTAAGLFIDIETAFDSAWREGLLVKLVNMKIPLQLICILQSFLSDRFFQVRIKDELSPKIPMLAGMPQGAVLSPLLFSLFMADIPTSEFTSLLQFADDTALVSESANAVYAAKYLQRAAAKLETWMSKWRFRLNVEKTQLVLFCPSGRKPKFKFILEGQVIEWQSQVKYLGVLYDARLTFKWHIVSKCAELKKTLFSLMFLLGRRSKLSCRSKSLLYKVIARTRWGYAAPAWCCVKNTHWERLQRIQNWFLRVILNQGLLSPMKVPELHERTCVSSVVTFVQGLTCNFLERMDEHPNDDIIRYVMYDLRAPYRSSCKRPRHFLLTKPPEY